MFDKTWCCISSFAAQVDVVFEEVDEIALQEPGLPFVAGRYAEPVQPDLLRMRTLLAASQCNVALVNGVEQVRMAATKGLPVWYADLYTVDVAAPSQCNVALVSGLDQSRMVAIKCLCCLDKMPRKDAVPASKCKVVLVDGLAEYA